MITDFLIRLKNASKAYKKAIEYPYSNAVHSIAIILEKESFVNRVYVSKEKKVPAGRGVIKIDLKYDKNMPSISDIKLISKPSIHYYVGKNKMSRVVQKNSIGIVSTNKGMMTARDARKLGIGGELICQIF